MSIRCGVYDVNKIFHFAPCMFTQRKTKCPLLQDVFASKVQNLLGANIFLIIFETQEVGGGRGKPTKKPPMHSPNSKSRLFSFTRAFHLFQHGHGMISIFGNEKRGKKVINVVKL